jgi:hypothetical protein
VEFLKNMTGKDCLVYALDRNGAPNGNDGMSVDRQAYKKGWPVRIRGLMPDYMPHVGPSSKICSFDMNNDGRDEIVANFTSAKTTILDGTGSIIREMDMGPFGKKAVGIMDSSMAFNLFSIAALGDINGNGTPEIVMGGMTLMGVLNIFLAGQNLPFNHVIQAWDITTGRYLESYPRAIDDWTVYAEPALADVSGDGVPDVIAGSGMFLLHAFGSDGYDQPGFPKLSGGWIMTTPAVGDIDSDGLNEVAAVTREGWILVWDTPGKSSRYSSWPTYGHDNLATSNLSTDATAPAGVTSYTVYKDGISFICPGDDGFAGKAKEIILFGDNNPIDAFSIRELKPVKTVESAEGGSLIKIALERLYKYYAVAAVDEAGNVSQTPLDSSAYIRFESPDSIYGNNPAKGESGDTVSSGVETGSGSWCFIRASLN